jgi:hypothetical protein
VATFDAEGFDVGAGGLGDPKAVQCQERDQGMLGRGSEAGGDEQRADLLAVQLGGVGLIVQAEPADMDGRGAVEEAFLDPCICRSRRRCITGG